MKIGLGIGLINKSTSGGAAFPVNVVAPVISGTTIVGSTLSCTTGTWTGIPNTFIYGYQWYRNDILIIGANSNTYVTVAADSAAVITCVVTANNCGIALPSNTVAPAISGTAVVGQTLTTSNGTWNGTPLTYDYRWFRGTTQIGTNSNSYTLVQADAGNTSNITCIVTANNTAGSANATSNTIARILDTLTNNYITGLTLTSGEIDSFNTLYLALRSNNYHTEIDRLNIYGSATQAASNKSLFGSFTATPINSPTWSRKVGYTHTGTSYLTTGYTPSINSVKATLNNNSYIVGFNNLPNTADSMLGGATSAGLPSGLTLYSLNVNLLIRSYATGNITAFTNRLLSDTYTAIVRTSSTSITGYLNSATSVNASTVNNPIVDLEIFEGARNLNGAASLPMISGSISRYGCIGSNAVNPVTLNTIIANFITSL